MKCKICGGKITKHPENLHGPGWCAPLKSTPSSATGAICGGMIKQSVFMQRPMAHMMALVMPDKQFDKYKGLIETGNEKEAKVLRDKYAWSVI